MYSNLLYASNSILAEGLHWDQKRQLLWFVDIDAKALISLDIDNILSRTIKMPEKIGWVITQRNTNDLIIGLKTGIASINPDINEKKIQWITRDYPSEKRLRLNDAKADPSGCIWLGSLNDEDQELSEGCLARLDQSGQIKIVDSGYKVTNGPAIDAGTQRFFHTDSLRRTIYQFDINIETSELTNKRIWKTFDSNYGYPDGMCFDKNGFLWVAHWGSGLVTQLDNGANIVNSVNIPTLNVTNVCFSGVHMDRLIVSTARSVNNLKHKGEPETGSIFEILGHNSSGAEVYSSNVNK